MTTDIQGSGTYRISRVIGNNFVCTVDETGREVILRGLGIGFKKKPGDLVPGRQIEKIYALRDPEQSSRLQQLLADVPPEFLEVSTEIIEMAEQRIGRRRWTASASGWVTACCGMKRASSRCTLLMPRSTARWPIWCASPR